MRAHHLDAFDEALVGYSGGLGAQINPQLRPVIDRVFRLSAAKNAYRHLQTRAHVGKVVIAFD